MTSDHSDHPGREERSSARGNRGLEWRSEGTGLPGSHWAVSSPAPGWGRGSGLHGGPSDCFNSFGPQGPTLCFSRHPPLHSQLFLGWHGGPERICNSGGRSLPGLMTGRRPALQWPPTKYQAPMCTHGTRCTPATEKASGIAVPSSGHSLLSPYPSPLCLDSLHGLLSVTHSSKCLSVACQGPGTGLSVFFLLTHFILTGTPLNREASGGSQSQTIHPSHTAHAWMRPRLLTDLLQSSQRSLSSSDLPLLSPHTTHPETSVTPHSPCRTSSCLQPTPPYLFSNVLPPHHSWFSANTLTILLPSFHHCLSLNTQISLTLDSDVTCSLRPSLIYPLPDAQ